MHNKSTGLTLIELLIVIAIIAILAVVGIPAYSGYIAKSKVTTAQADLENLSMRLNNRYQRMLSYPTVNADNTAALEGQVNGWEPVSEATDFAFTNSAASAASYTINATGLTGRFEDCVISLSEDGDKAITNCDALAADGNWL